MAGLSDDGYRRGQGLKGRWGPLADALSKSGRMVDKAFPNFNQPPATNRSRLRTSSFRGGLSSGGAKGVFT